MVPGGWAQGSTKPENSQLLASFILGGQDAQWINLASLDLFFGENQGRTHARGPGPAWRQRLQSSGNRIWPFVAVMSAGRELQEQQGCSLGDTACQVATQK
ncbi:MAG TPA: hypothetical protein VMY43_04185 [Methanothrix sp.]|nr:hypothetical protein [Methanothrix sp.]